MARAADRDFRTRLARVVFESDTPAGRAFDVALLWSIVLSILLVMLESVSSVRSAYGGLLRGLEWGFTVLFTLEYLVRLYAARRAWRYASSPLGLVDLLTIVPSYLSLLLPGAQSLLAVRALRLLRVFRILKLSRTWAKQPCSRRPCGQAASKSSCSSRPSSPWSSSSAR